MPKTLLLAAAVLIGAAWLPGQEGQMGQSAGKASNLATIDGCLSNTSGQYFVTDSSGTRHELSGSTNKLKPLIGHQVQVSGKPSVKTEASTSYGAASSAEQIPVFEVKSVKQLSDTCLAK